MDYAAIRERLLSLMNANHGRLTADVVERDAKLAADRELASAAAHELASDPDVICGEETDGQEWFPYSFLARS